MKRFLVLILLFILGLTNARSQTDSQLAIGTRHTILSTILKEERAYYIQLPESYHEPGANYKTYPVLILLDGNLHFKALAGLVNYMSSDRYRSWKFPEMIVIGIENVDRRRDYTPDKVVTVRENTSGGGDNFLRFLEEELIPELEKNYRTAPYRILFGHSLGGLLTVHAYMKKETLFNAFIAVDPSFGSWDAPTMDEKIAGVSDSSFHRYLYMATANWEKRNFKNRDRHTRLFEALNSICPGVFYGTLEYFENENHASVPPVAFLHGMSSIFSGYGISWRDVDSSEDLVLQFEAISDRLSWTVHPPEHLVNQLGYQFLRSKDEQERRKALDCFILNTENYPGSFNAFDSLGEAYEVLGDPEKALVNYRRSLDLHPGNENARMKIISLSD